MQPIETRRTRYAVSVDLVRAVLLRGENAPKKVGEPNVFGFNTTCRSALFNTTLTLTHLRGAPLSCLGSTRLLGVAVRVG